MSKKTLAEQLALWADTLRDVSALGLRYSQSAYDNQNYQKVQTIAMEMLAQASGESVEALEPLKETHFSRPTPLSVGDGAVIDEAGRMLLIRRADNGLWAMPGGMLEVGESPAEGVVREVLEETGVRCAARSFLGVYDSRLTGGKSRFHLYHLTFLCEPVRGTLVEPPEFANEITDKGWFVEDDLPTAVDPGHASRISNAFQVWRRGGDAFYDAPDYDM